jgi:transposase
MPNWEEVHRELSRRGVTLRLLWLEYREKHPDGYGRTQFQEYYQRWKQTHTTSMRLPHKAGEVMEVDYAGMTLPITNAETGEVWQAAVFVAVLPASNYIYAEVQPSQELQHWLAGHVRAFTFFGGAPKILRPDNLKSGVKKPNYYEPDLNPSYHELAEHYRVAVLPARVRKPKDYPEVLQIPKNMRSRRTPAEKKLGLASPLQYCQRAWKKLRDNILANRIFLISARRVSRSFLRCPATRAGFW